MGKLIKYLGRYKLQCLLVLVLLVVQAVCDLALPDYTADIMDTGIMQKGVDRVSPKVISESSMNDIMLFAKDEEKAVLDLYKGILDIARNTSGRTYDLCYLNEGSSGFDPDRHFAFLRGGEGRATLFVCDFSGKDSIVDVAITPEAFAYMGINKKETLVKSVSLRGYGYSALPV